MLAAEIFDQVVNAPICTGLERLIVLPCPNPPKLPIPQTHSVPFVLMAALLALPAEILREIYPYNRVMDGAYTKDK